MFNGCKKLKEIKINNFDTLNTTDMTCMFNNYFKFKKFKV